MEEWDIYDQYRRKTGRTTIRGTRLKPDEFHLVVHICIINSNNQMLIQQRQPFKKGWPDKWDVSIGGSANVGENSNQVAERELMEEIGYAFDFSSVRPAFTINFKRGFDDFYILKADINLQQLTLQEAEVKAVKWASKNEILAMIQQQEFIPYHPSIINLIFDMQNGYGAHFT